MKKLFLILVLIALAFTIIGCPFWVSPEHSQAHAKAIDIHGTEIHKFVDRHFWLYDWEDPYVN